MSMQLVTTLQIIYMIAIYLVVIILIPAAVFYPFLEDRPFSTRFLAYLTIGNFYIINLVYLLQLLHLSNWFTLVLGVLVPAGVAIAKIHWESWAKSMLTSVGETTYGVIVKTVGMRLILARVLGFALRAAWENLKKLAKAIAKHPVDTFGTILIILLVIWQYGTNVVTHFGYMASDNPVHHYWLNAMCENDIFVGGVYPFGMHNVLYFLHKISGLEILTLFRVFGLWQTFLIHLVLLLFLRQVCKSEVAAYTAVVLFLASNLLNYNTPHYPEYNTLDRLFRTLPQEYGMVFILPAIAFLLSFFENRKEETGLKGWKLESTKDLALFAMCFSLTLTIHFYDTMIAGLFCVAVAVGFVGYLFRKEFLWRVLLAGVLSIVVAVLPMFAAFVTGTPLEGSLRWGMSILQSSSEKTQGIPADLAQAGSQRAWEIAADVCGVGFPVAFAGTSRAMGTGVLAIAAAQTADGAESVGSASRKTFLDQWVDILNDYISESLGKAMPGVEFFLLILSFACGLIALWLKERHYGCVMISVAVYVFLLCVIMVSRLLGIPALMEQDRCSTYLAYSLFLVVGLLLDFGMYVALAWIQSGGLRKLVMLAVSLAFVGLVFEFCGIRQVYLGEAMEKNGAIICVSNILHENKPETFTIVSANDELRMVEQKGYFYEIITLLRGCEGENVETFLSIPTPKVYVFVEKIPGDYREFSEYKGQGVSRVSAGKKLPSDPGLFVYKGTNRHIVMSKMYYWAQEFQKQYRNEMSVYYEDEEFVCYLIEQNIYRPYDLSIDYGYNNAGLTMP